MKTFEEMTLEERHAFDLQIPCPNCGVEQGKECLEFRPGVVHLGRRIKRLAIDRRPDLLDPPS